MYYTGRRGKEGLRNLCKSSFKVDKTADGKEFIEITFNEKTKKNQGDSMSTSVNALHNDHHIILNKIYTNHQIRKNYSNWYEKIWLRRSRFTQALCQWTNHDWQRKLWRRLISICKPEPPSRKYHKSPQHQETKSSRRRNTTRTTCTKWKYSK